MNNCKQSTFFNGLSFNISYKEMEEPIRLWAQNMLAQGPAHCDFCFVKTGCEYNIACFYTKNGEKICEYLCDSIFAGILFEEGIIVGKVYVSILDDTSDKINLSFNLVANPKENNPKTIDLAQFKKKLINFNILFKHSIQL